MSFDLNNKRIWVAGHEGMVGQAICRRLAGENCEVLTISHSNLDCRNQVGVRDWLQSQKPDGVIIAAWLIMYLSA